MVLPDDVARDPCAQIDRDLILFAVALGVAKPGRAFAVGPDVVDDRILHVRADPGWHAIETELVTHAPGDIVIRAGAIAADSNRAGDALVVVERKPATEDDDPANRLADHGIVVGPKLVRRAAVDDIRGRRVAQRRAEQESAGLGPC